MASAIVTAQTEIHMIVPMIDSPLNALMWIWFRWRLQMSGPKIQFRDVRVPIAPDWVKSIKPTHRALAAVQSRPHAFLAVTAIIVSAATAQAAQIGSVVQGLAIAREGCNECHLTVKENGRSTNEKAPTFARIANIPGINRCT